MEAEGLSKRAMDADDKTVTPPPTDPTEDKYHGKPPLAKRGGYRSLIIAVGLPFLLGSAQGFLFPPDKWYVQLNKPSWTPPGWAFAVAWSLIYPIMGLASWLVWANGGWHKQTYPLSLYVLQLALNLLWSFAFFKLHSPVLALGDMILLVVAVVACIGAFKRVNHAAANLMHVYLTWILFATVLNFATWYMNMSGGGTGEEVVRASPAE